MHTHTCLHARTFTLLRFFCPLRAICTALAVAIVQKFSKRDSLVANLWIKVSMRGSKDFHRHQVMANSTLETLKFQRMSTNHGSMHRPSHASWASADASSSMAPNTDSRILHHVDKRYPKIINNGGRSGNDGDDEAELSHQQARDLITAVLLMFYGPPYCSIEFPRDQRQLASGLRRP